MNDDFLGGLREEPRPEFREELWRRLEGVPTMRPAPRRLVFALGSVAAAIILLTVGLGIFLARTTGDDEAVVASAFSISPMGEDVPRLTPIRVTFERPPAERDPEKLLVLDPRPEGRYAWLNDRTLIFQPAYPGLQRGKEYRVSVPARPEAGLRETQQATFTTEGPLVIETVVPAPGDQDVPANAQVLVQFSRSVAPLTVLSQPREEPVITFDPPLKGRGEWVNTSLYRFVPEQLEPDTVYTARIRAGLSSAVDGVLEQDYVWSFTSFGPAIESVTPEDGSLNASLRQPVTVRFNQPMDRASVEALFRVRAAADDQPVAGTITWSDDARELTFVPTGDLRHASTYRITLPEGLQSARGRATTVARTSSFTTIARPAVRSTTPPDGATAAERYAIRIDFAGPMDFESFEGRVSVTGFTRAEVDAALSLYDPQQLGIGLVLKPSTSYTVSLAAGITDRYGQPLPPFSFSFRTGALEPTLSFALPGQVVTYSASQEPILVYHAANRDTATFTLWPLTASEAETILANAHVPKPAPGQEFQPSLPALRTWTERPENRPDALTVNTTSLSGGGPLPKGNYYVRSAGGGFNSEFAFSVVDTAIVLKLGSDSMLAWVFDLDTGRPVANAPLAISGAGAKATSATTDASGLATVPVAPRDPFSGFYPTFTVTTRADGRYGVANTNWRRGVEPYQLGIPADFYSPVDQLVGHIYTDRAIYRPGEEVHFKVAVRRDDDATYTIPGEVPDLTWTIISAQGNGLSSGKVTLNEFGTFAGSFTLPSDAEPGSHGIQLTWSRGQGVVSVAGNSFLVAEFRRPEFEVTVSSDRSTYASGDTIRAAVDASFFFGGQVPGAAVTWTAQSSPYLPRFEGLERYSFADEDRFFRRDPVRRSTVGDPTRGTGSGVTGDDGQFAFTLPAEVRGNEGPQVYTLSATVTDQGGQAVASSTAVTVHPADLYAGVRAEEYIAAAGSATRVAVVSVSNAGERRPNVPVTLRIYERKWITTKEATSGGGRTYRSEPVDTLLQTLTTTTDGRGDGSFTITPQTAGTLRLVAEVTDGRGRVARTATYLWVSSGEFASWYFSNDDAITLIPDRLAYEVGDTASILVPAPFDGATGLVTVERAKVHSAEVRSFASNSTVIEVPITAQSVPNIFVSTVLYRPPTAADPIPRYKVGYAQLPVSTKTRVLDITITPDRDQTKPGETVRYDVRVTDSEGRPVVAELSVAVVDKAVVSLAEERGPDGLKAFWFERGLGVATASSLAVSVNRSNDVILEPRSGKGGGGVEDERLRQEFKNLAYWNAQLLTDENGRASFQVTMPDNLTTWRTQVRAISGDTLVGEATQELLSTQPLLLRPALPRFVRAGDALELRLLVRNGTADTREVDVTLEATGIAVRDASARRVSVPPGQSRIVSWPATVADEGEVQVTFRATSSGGLSDSVRQTFPAYHDLTPETVATGGVVKQRPRTEAVYLPEWAITDRGSLDIAVQASLTGLLGEELAAFRPPPAPFDAKEDTSSIAARVLATSAVLRAAREGGEATSGYRSRLETDVARLISRQGSDGGWRWCDLCGESSPWVTRWVLLALGEAQRAGRDVDGGIVARATGYLSAHLAQPRDIAAPLSADERAETLAAIALAGNASAVASPLQALFEQQRAALTTTGRGWLALGLFAAGRDRNDPAVQALLGDITAAVIPSANGNHWEGGSGQPDHWRERYDSDAIRTTAIVVAALTASDPSHPLIEESVRWLMSARRTSGWNGGIGGALSLSALTGFGLSTGELTGSSNYRVRVGEATVSSGEVRGSDATARSTTVPLDDLPKGEATIVEFERSGAAKGRLYYAMNLRYLTPAREIEALNRGIAVSHTYTALADPDTPIASAKVGEVIRVTVTVVTPAERREVRVEDFLPAGFEPIDASLKTTDPALIRQLEEERRKAAADDGDGVYAPWYRWYRSPFEQAAIRDDRVVLYATRLGKGLHQYIYYVRATTPGDFFVAPAVASEAQFPEVFGRSDSGRFTVLAE